MSVREPFLSVIIHRNYQPNAPVKFYEFSDRVEVMRARGLFGMARPENLPDINDYRNPGRERLKIWNILINLTPE